MASSVESKFAATVGRLNLFGLLAQLLVQGFGSLNFFRARYRRIVACHRLRTVIGHLFFSWSGGYVGLLGVLVAIAGIVAANEGNRIASEQSRLAASQTRAAEAQARAADAAYASSLAAEYTAERARLRGLIFDRDEGCSRSSRYCPHDRCAPMERRCPLRSPIRLRSDAVRELVDVERNWRARRHDVLMMPIDLQGVELSGASLAGADLSGVDLRDSILRGADLTEADLTGAWLQGADLTRSGLRDADFSCASLVFADLTGADTVWVTLFRADLSSARGGEAFFSGFGPREAAYDEFTELGNYDPGEYDMQAGGTGSLGEAFTVDARPSALDLHEWCSRRR